MALSLVGPREVLGHLLAENMALDKFELYRNPKTGGRRINIDWFCHLVVKVVLHLLPKINNFILPIRTVHLCIFQVFLKRNLPCCTKLIVLGAWIGFSSAEMKKLCLFADNIACACSALSASPRAKQLSRDGARPLEPDFSHSEWPENSFNV